MRLKKLLICMLCLLCLSMFSLSIVHAEVSDVYSVAGTEIAKYVADNSAFSTGYSTEDATFKLKWGDATDLSALNDFASKNTTEVYQYDRDQAINCFFYYTTTQKPGVVAAGKKGYESVIEVTAINNMALTVKNAAFETTAGNLIVETFVSDNTSVVKVKSVKGGAKSSPIAEDALGGEYHLKAGDKLYFVVGSTNTYTILNNAIYPAFDISLSKYSAAKRNEYYPKEDNDVSAVEIASYIHENKAYNEGYVTTNAEYHLKWGDSTDLTALNNFASSNEEGELYKYDGPNKIDCFFYFTGDTAGQISAGQKGYETVAEVVAKKNIVVIVKNATFTTGANNLVVYTYLCDDTLTIPVKTVVGGGTGTIIDENAFGGEYHLQAGNKLYFVVSSTNGYTIRRNPINLAFEVTENGYDPDVQESYYELQRKRPIKVAELQEYINGINMELYSSANQIQLGTFVEEFEGETLGCSTIDELNALYDNYIARIGAVKTIEQETAELTAYKAEKTAELQEYYDSLTGPYSKENKELLSSTLESAKAEIEAATSKNAANLAVTKAKNAMSKVEVSAGGCLTAINGGSIAIVLVLFGVLMFAKKKEQE